MLGQEDELEPSGFSGDGVKVDELVLSIPEGVATGEGTALDISLPVDSGVVDNDDTRLSVIDSVERGVILSLPDGEVEVVGTALAVILALPPKEIVDGGVSDGVNVFEQVAVGVTVLEPVDESEPVSALEGVTDRVGTALGVSLALPPNEIVDGGEAVLESELASVEEGDAEKLCVTETVGELVIVCELVDEGVEDELAPRD